MSGWRILSTKSLSLCWTRKFLRAFLTTPIMDGRANFFHHHPLHTLGHEALAVDMVSWKLLCGYLCLALGQSRPVLVIPGFDDIKVLAPTPAVTRWRSYSNELSSPHAARQELKDLQSPMVMTKEYVSIFWWRWSEKLMSY